MAIVNVDFSSEINAPAEKVWDILVDIESWPEWQGTTYVKPISPLLLREGSVFDVKLGPTKWNVTITKADRPRELVWTGRAPGFNAVHQWEFQEREGKTAAVTREGVSGWLAVPLYFMVRNTLRKLDANWLADLKARAEAP